MAALLTSAAGPRNVARYMQYIPMLAEVEADVIESFRNGGGVPHVRYPRLQALMAESSGLRFDHLLLDKVLPLTDMQAVLRMSTMHCMTVSLALGGAGLGTVWGEQTALKMLAEVGFAKVEVSRLSDDLLNNYYVARKA